MKLDRSRSFAQVIGHPVAKYEQDGREFDQEENLIGGPVEKDAPADAPKRRGRPPKVAE